MSKAIASIRLAPGRCGYFDEKTRIHLTLAQPVGTVFDYMDFSDVKQAVKDGVLILTCGSFKVEEEVETDFVEVPKVEKVAPAAEVEEETKPKAKTSKARTKKKAEAEDTKKEEE